jgi:hypothetical protein
LLRKNVFDQCESYAKIKNSIARWSHHQREAGHGI